MYSRSALCGLLLFAVFGIACKNQPARAIDRIAVIPFENLSADATLDWIGAVAPYLLMEEMAGAGRIVAIAAGAERDSAAVRASQLLQGYYSKEGGTLRLHAVLREIDTSRTVRMMDAQGSLADVLARIGQPIAGQVRPVDSTNAMALESLGRGLLSRDLQEKLRLVGAAHQAEPKASVAAAVLAQLRLASGDSPGARKVLNVSLQGRQESWERAQLKLLLARIEADRSRLIEALQEGIRTAPNDADLSHQLGQTYMERHRYAEGIPWLRRAVDLEPNHIPFLNLLAYGQAYARDFDAALATVQRYRSLAPDDPNAFDTAGEIYWFAGRFADAEKNFLEAQQKQPQFLGGLEFAKAAFARFLSGDVAGADENFNRYMESRRALQDGIAGVRHAHWLYLTGRRQKGIEEAASIGATDGEPASLANTLLAIWLLQAGKQPPAFEAARSAASKARTPPSVTGAAMVAFLAQPEASAGEWRSRVDRMLNAEARPQFKRQLLAYALFLGKHYAQAAQLLEAMYQETAPSGGDEVRMLLAYTKLQTDRKKEAVELLASYPLPPRPGESIFASLYFPDFVKWKE